MYQPLSLTTSSRVETNLRNLCDLGPRHSDSELARAASFILDELHDYGYADASIIRQPVPTRDSDIRFNIIVRNFSNPLFTRIVAGAHYDTVRGTVGADDNGSGVAMLLEMARQLRQDTVPVELVFFVNEEPPYFSTGNMGSSVYFKAIDSEELFRYRQFINLDCVGFFKEPLEALKDGFVLSEVFSDPYVPDDSVGLIVSGTDFKSLDLFSDWTSSVPLVKVKGTDLPYLSDLQWFYGHIPCVHIADMALTRNHRIHSPEDTPDTLDYIRMGAVTDGVVGVIQKGWY